ncbi:Retinol dehydrogenase 14 [Colletotrichum gloeosporioides]|uniref:Retinol dehydrogenase 14 n=1 Tax=Colletotrichum gloeosporioides TaxID=474922 RepID=A0A8H4CVS0_COLGL|nr:Retinol dehydrogenase 14 [Colletotrichum gloeosporioides]KAF3810854.1 Retinol dehydrogenase 14 [Colletotrichum gloeosporioides]
MGFLYSQLFIEPKYPTDLFTEQVIIVTGSNVGLGFEAARHFVRLNAARVIIAVRNVEAGHKAKETIEQSTGRQGVCEVWEVDLASYDSVRAFSARASQLPRLDLLMANAGIATTRFTAAEGHERSITVNVISTFLLAFLLGPEVHAWTDLPEWKTENTFKTLDGETTADMNMRYPATKLLQILVTRELAARLEGSGVVVNMLQPGMCHSELTREDGWTTSMLKLVLARSTEVGSRTLVAAASTGIESHGIYMRDGEIDNEALSPFVRSGDGATAQEKVWEELSRILEDISPGATAF